MQNFYISDIKINKVRHLENISIPIAEEKIKHLILTGKNGSGKTSVLDALSKYLENAVWSASIEDYQFQTENSTEYSFQDGMVISVEEPNIANINKRKRLSYFINELEYNELKKQLGVRFNASIEFIKKSYREGQFILAYYKAERVFETDIPKHVEKVDINKTYTIEEKPRQLFVKYLLDLKMSEALARSSGKLEKASVINQWFVKFQELLRRIFEDDLLELVFEEDTFKFYIKETNREPFDFNSLSSGFAAILDIVVDIIIRMEKTTNKTFNFNVPGIVLIDEIETHLHLEMQKTVLELLTSVFPNIQFIVSTHSPFVLNSLQNVVIYDLENNIIVKDGLTNVPYGGIVEGYFKANDLSVVLKNKFERYKELVKQEVLSDADFNEIMDLELYLNEIPDFLALDISTEYKRIKLEFEKREDV